VTRINLLLLFVLVGCALSLVTSRHDARRTFNELERERERARQYEVEYGQLSLEQSTWAMPARVEKIARESLHMQMPLPSRVQVIEAPAQAAKCTGDNGCDRAGAAIASTGAASR
jgi:cell division protein FtsL